MHGCLLNKYTNIEEILFSRNKVTAIFQRGCFLGHPVVSSCIYLFYRQVLAAIPDQDTFYDMIDSLEGQDMEKTVQAQMKKKGARAELLQQLGAYETALKEEDSRDSMKLDLIENVRCRIYSYLPIRIYRFFLMFRFTTKFKVR